MASLRPLTRLILWVAIASSAGCNVTVFELMPLVEPSPDCVDVAPSGPLPRIRVLVLYTEATRIAAATADHPLAILDEIDTAIDEANLAMDDSGIQMELVLAHAEEVSFDGDETYSSYAEDSDGNQYEYPATVQELLDALTSSTDFFLKEAHTLRDAHSADIVVLWFQPENDSYGDSNGKANLLEALLPEYKDQAFAVVNYGRVFTDLTFTHEMGHLFGGRHEWVWDWCWSEAPNPFWYNHGYNHEYPDGGEWCADTGVPESSTLRGDCSGGWYTAMGIWCAKCCRLNLFSNPEIQLCGEPAGVVATNPERPPEDAKATGPADNRLTLNNTASMVAGYIPTSVWFLSGSGQSPWDELRVADQDITELMSGDFSGDEAADIFHADPIEGKWYVSANGTEPWEDRGTGMGPFGVSDFGFGDFDGNGKIDVFRVDESGPSFTWLVSYSGTASTAWVTLNSTPGNHPFSELAIGHFDDDDDADVFRVDPATGLWYVSYSGTESWQQLGPDDGDFELSELAFGDFNGDEQTDVLAVDGDWWIVSDGGSGGWLKVRQVADAWAEPDVMSRMAFGDFNGDGNTDVFATVLILAEPITPEWSVFHSVERTGAYDPIEFWTHEFEDREGINSYCHRLEQLLIGDFNGDDVSDVFRTGVRP